jgi:hypothetical protein
VITLRVSADVKDDRQIVLTLPSNVPTGKAELLVTVNPQSTGDVRRPRSSLADRAEESADHWGQRLSAADVDFILEILRELKGVPSASQAVPEKYPILRVLQMITDHRTKVVGKLGKE